MRPLALFLGGPLLLTALLTATRTRADDDAMASAVADFDLAFKELSLSAPCDTMCRALQSMVRAADRICDLARDGTAADQKRCADAKQKIAEATAKVRAACPNCDPSPPYAPSTTPGPKPATPKPDDSDKPPSTKEGKTTLDAGGYAAAPRPNEEARLEVSALGRRTTLSLDVLPLFAPPFVIQPRLERSVTPWLSITLTGGYGSLPKSGPAGKGRASVLAIGGEVRGYVFGGFDRFGVFVAADVMHRSVQGLEVLETLSARTFPLGLTVGGLVGTKLVTRAGFTLEARVGAGYVADDRRPDGGARVLPHGGVSAGWTF